jgi:glycosyltransferase involved in cell wall biosynthesis
MGFDAIVGQAATVESKFCNDFRWNGLRTTIPALPDPLEVKTKIDTPQLDVSKGIRAAYFGRLEPYKGVGFLIERWEELSGCISSLDVYGNGVQRQELEELVRRKQLTGTIRFLGKYPDGEDYVRLIQQYHLSLLPTMGQEGAPLVLLESMACGIPFVANGMGGIPGYANQDCEITSGNINDFIPAVNRCCERLIKREIDPGRLRAFYLENFSYGVLSQRWNQFLTSLCNS